jgi:DNA-binding transcriptional LysR family regulator
MELRQLRYAEAVAAHRHFTRAAAAIGVAQPALSHQIKRLEQELGIELFERSRGGVRLTAAGETFLPRIRRALTELDAGRDEVAAFTGLEAGRVRLGAMQAVGPLDLPRAIARFHEAHPAVEVTLIEESTVRMQQLVVDGQLDLAIVALEVGYPNSLEARPIVREAVLLALRCDHPLARRATVEFGRLRGEPFVFFRTGTGMRTTTERLARDAGFIPQMAFETGNLDRLLDLVGEGLGVSLIPASTAARAHPSIRAIPFSPSLSRTVGVVWRADHSPSPATRAMRDLLTHCVAQADGSEELLAKHTSRRPQSGRVRN